MVASTQKPVPKMVARIAVIFEDAMATPESINDPEHREEFLAWLQTRIESSGYTVFSVPKHLANAYHSGNPKDLNPLVWQEWYDWNNPDWKAKARAEGGLKSRNGERYESPKLKRSYN